VYDSRRPCRIVFHEDQEDATAGCAGTADVGGLEQHPIPQASKPIGRRSRPPILPGCWDTALHIADDLYFYAVQLIYKPSAGHVPTELTLDGTATVPRLLDMISVHGEPLWRTILPADPGDRAPTSTKRWTPRLRRDGPGRDARAPRPRTRPDLGEPHVDRLGARLSWLRAGVFGANDGIVSVAGLVAGATTAGGPIFTAGLAGLVAGAASMALGEYVSVSSQRDTELAAMPSYRSG
jgi:hypothetical protein